MKLSEKYQREIDTHQWRADNAQRQAVARLEQLLEHLQQPDSLWTRFIGGAAAAPKGLYLWGGVGRGKTWLMDLFYQELVNVPKMRQHFHRFIQDVHAQLRDLQNVEDPLLQVAKRIRQRARVVCFDEFFVADIADAMILGRLFTRLFELGTVLVATSNVPPDQLYKDGLQRSRFLPAIETLKANTDTVHVDGGHDYRLQALATMDIFHSPHDDAAQRLLDEYFDAIAPDSGTHDAVIILEGRPVSTVRRADSIIWFTFSAICDGPRGIADYIEIARTFQTVIVSQVPQLDVSLENQARRFIALVDEFYDRRVNLIISAAVALEELYQGHRLLFEFERTRSRLMEMQSAEYLAMPHLP